MDKNWKQWLGGFRIMFSVVCALSMGVAFILLMWSVEPRGALTVAVLSLAACIASLLLEKLGSK